MRKSYTVVDLFAGGGGFSRGFEEAGFVTLVAVDNYPPAAKTFKLNFPHSLVIADDIKEVSADIVDVKPDVVIASPPCEPFTSANPNRMKDPVDRLYSDPAGELFLHAIRLIGELRPKVYVIENVRGILEVKDYISKELERVGYESHFNVLRAHEHGTASERTRVFVSNIKLRPERRSGPIVEEALAGLPPLGSLEVPNHEYPGEAPKRKRREMQRLRWGQSLIMFRGAEGSLHPNYIRLDPRKRAPTVMGSSRFIHPYEDRLLTVREQARLMGFPDHHIFVGNRDAQYNMVGEAVPPPLARAIAEEIHRFLRASRVDPI